MTLGKICGWVTFLSLVDARLGSIPPPDKRQTSTTGNTKYSWLPWLPWLPGTWMSFPWIRPFPWIFPWIFSSPAQHSPTASVASAEQVTRQAPPDRRLEVRENISFSVSFKFPLLSIFFEYTKKRSWSSSSCSLSMSITP